MRWMLKGLVLPVLMAINMDASAVEVEPPAPKFEVKEFVVYGQNFLGAERTFKILNDFLGEHEGMEGLLAATDALETELVKEGYSFSRVVLPPQTLKEGKITLKVVDFKVGKVTVEGNEYFGENNIRASLPELVTGKIPNTRILSRALQVANEHPAKKAQLLFQESEEPGSIDAVIRVKDQSPISYFTSLNNTGNAETGELRLTAGISHGNLFQKDHALTFTYTMSPTKPEKVSQTGLSYNIPLYEEGASLLFLSSFSNVKTGVVAGGFDVSGAGTVLSSKYKQQILKIGAYKHYWSAGWDYKEFVNDIKFGSSNLGGTVHSTPLVAEYGGSYQASTWASNLSTTFSYNLPVGGSSDASSYNTARSGAKPEWYSIKYNLGWNYFPNADWMFNLMLSGQVGSGTLIPGEQFAMGGPGSLRGFAPGAVTGDDGNQVNLEMWMPGFTSYKIRPIAFVGVGSKLLKNPQTGEVASESPASAGLGIRWTWKESLNVELDYGVVSQGAGTTKAGASAAHFNMMYRF